MTNGGFWILGELSDEALEQSLSALIRAGSQKEAQVVAHLAEV